VWWIARPAALKKSFQAGEKLLFPATDQSTMKNCAVCLIEHDEEIHTATLNVRAFLRERMRTVLGVEKTPSVEVDPSKGTPA
jgi:hypothetical protein